MRNLTCDLLIYKCIFLLQRLDSVSAQGRHQKAQNMNGWLMKRFVIFNFLILYTVFYVFVTRRIVKFSHWVDTLNVATWFCRQLADMQVTNDRICGLKLLISQLLSLKLNLWLRCIHIFKPMPQKKTIFWLLFAVYSCKMSFFLNLSCPYVSKTNVHLLF